MPSTVAPSASALRVAGFGVLGALLLISAAVTPAAPAGYDAYFTPGTLRVDYHHTGTKGSESFSLDALHEEGPWPGSVVNLVDTLNLGEYMVRVYDRDGARLIFSRGYSTMFNEWQTTDEAGRGVLRTFHESVRIPFPRKAVQLTISRRDRGMDFRELFSTVIDPSDPTAIHREKRAAGYKSVELMRGGDPRETVDLVIVGDGYTAGEMEQFRADAKRLNDAMFSTEPFKSRKSDFSVRTVEAVSAESGIDKPDKNVWKGTALGTTYNTFGSARYILTTENRALRDAIAGVPYDFVLILVNDNRYGGGGIYNLYTTCYARTDAPGMDWQMDYVYVHEFGHSFGGLGDEYYSSQVSYNEFYPKGVEPWEPNLTALTDKDRLKWKDLAAEGIALPTPWEKKAYDSLGAERGKLDRLAADYYEKREPLQNAQMNILKGHPLAGKVGAFEGAGYVSEGIYRPSVDCRMFTLSLAPFDPVCARAISRAIDFYSR